MSKKTNTLSLILSVIAAAAAVVALVFALKPVHQPEQPNTDTQYVMYVGTNDKDTTEPVCTPEEAKERAVKVLLDHFGGYTIQEANGGWIDGDKVYTEYTLVIYLSDTDLEKVHAAADKLITEFNQSSILIQANQTVTEFYSGAN